MDESEQLLLDAEEQIEAWCCELDAAWMRIIADAHAEADAIVVVARTEAAALRAEAEDDARTLLAEAAANARVQQHDLAALGTAVVRLRTELSRVVDAALDALPAVEATAAALQVEEPAEAAPEPPTRRLGFVRRLLRR